jgi:sulfoxide reductase heme-binding subunit YedZ
MARLPAKPVVFLLALGPAVALAVQTVTGGLGANPPDAIIDRSGEWSLRLLLITLAVTPLRLITGWRWPMRVRRMLGLFAFFYGVVHLAAWGLFEHGLRPGPLWADLWDRPYLAAGFLAVAGMLPLAATSFDAAMRRLGRWWVRLHRLVYPIAVLSVLHYYLLVKADIREPLIHAGILALLLGYRVLPRRWQRAGDRLRPARGRGAAARA